MIQGGDFTRGDGTGGNSGPVAEGSVSAGGGLGSVGRHGLVSGSGGRPIICIETSCTLLSTWGPVQRGGSSGGSGGHERIHPAGRLAGPGLQHW